MRKILSIANQKGGVGKTTATVNLAAALGALGKKVLVVDFDPQGSASLSLGMPDNGSLLLKALESCSALPVLQTPYTGVDLVPSGRNLVAARFQFSLAMSQDLLSICLEQTQGPWDWVLIDCPPTLDIITLAALWSSRHVLIPVEGSHLSIHGLEQMVRTVSDLRDQGADLEIEAILPSRIHPRRRIYWEIMLRLEQEFPDKVAPVIRENVSLTEAPGKGKPVQLFARTSHGTRDFQDVCEWLLRRFEDETRPPMPWENANDVDREDSSSFSYMGASSN